MKKIFLGILALLILTNPVWAFPPIMGGGSSTPTEIDLHAAGAVITAAQISSTNAATAHNVAQAAGDVSNDLPAIAANLALTVTIAQARSNYFRLCAPEGDNMYIDGAATSYDCVGVAATVAGDFFQIFSMRTGAATYKWVAISGKGTLVGYNGVKP
jgi:hypothetical protein